MRYNETKSEFTNRMNHEKKNREQLRKAYNNIFLSLLDKYDGKVFNARFTNELREKLREFDTLMSCREESQHCDDITIYIECRNSPTNYSDTERLYIKVMCDRDDNYNYRVNAEKSKEDRFAVAWLENFDKETAQKSVTAKNYDKYVKLAEKLEAMIKEYNEIPSDFRNIVSKYYGFHIY